MTAPSRTLPGSSARRTVAVVDPCLSAGGSVVAGLVARGVDVVGVFTPWTDPPEGTPGLPLLEGRLDWRDGADHVCAALRDRRVDAVLVGDETAVEVAAAVAERLGLPGHDPGRAHACVDKHAMNATVAAAGLRTLPFRRVWSVDEALAWWRTTVGDAPIVVKPCRGYLGEGLAVCRDEADLRAGFATLGARKRWDDTPNDQVLVQQLGDGDITEVGLVTVDGAHEVALVMVSRKTGPVFDCLDVVGTDQLPAVAPQLAYARAVATALGIRNGPSFVEVMVLPDGGCAMIECNARVIGGLLDPWVQRATGTSQVTRALDALLDPAGFLRTRVPARGGRLPARIVVLDCDVAGRIAAPVRPFLDALRALPSHVAHSTVLAPGEPLARTIDAGSSPGMVYLAHPDPAVVDADHARIRALEAGGVYARLVGA